MKRVSISELITFDKCLRAYFLERILKVKGAPYLPFIIGNSVHDFVKYLLHNENKEGRTFFFKTEESAVSNFKHYWNEDIWPKNGGYFDNEDKNLKWVAQNKAIKNLRNYMSIAKNHGVPVMEEKLIVPVTELGCELVGVVDQKRPTNPVWAERNAIEKGGYVLIDLKTGKAPNGSSGQKDQVRLDNDIQPTMYYFLGKKTYGVKPDAFVFWFLGGDTPEIRTTFRDEKDEEDLFSKIRSFLAIVKENTSKIFKTNEEMEKYWPKTSNTYECKFCQYWSSCWKAKRPALTTIIDGKHEESPFSVSKATTINVKPVQAEFKYKGTRKKAITQKEKDRLEREKYEKLMLMKKNSNPS